MIFWLVLIYDLDLCLNDDQSDFQLWTNPYKFVWSNDGILLILDYSCYTWIYFDILVTACKFARFQIHVKKDFKKLLKLQEIVFEIIMMLIDCWLLMMIVVHPMVSKFNTMIFVWVITWLHFKFHSEIVCWNFTIWSLTSNEWILSEI